MENPQSNIVPEAVSELLARAKDGDVSVMPALVECCMSQSHPPDMSAAVRCALRNSLHNPDCMCLLGLMHLFGNGMEKNEQRAVTYLRKAANDGQPYAALMLARLKREARGGLKKNPVRELELLQQACSHGAEVGVAEQAALILAALTEQADARHPESCFRCAEVCRKAFCVPQALERAAHYYLLAAEAGHARAQYELGRCYAEGRGVPQDIRKGVECLLDAAAHGHEKALSELERTVARLLESAQTGEAEVMEVCGRILNTEDDADGARAVCLRCLRDAAERGSEMAQLILRNAGC